jgi:nudix-type nucleoside diphosphatase (YffH/AdpP family)
MRATVLSDQRFLLQRLEFEQRRFDGRWQTLEREVYNHGNAAVVLPFDPDRRTVLLVRQIRFVTYLNGHPHPILEACAGMIDAGETPEIAVQREAKEEMGCMLKHPRRVFDAFMSPGCFTERLTFFVSAYTPVDCSNVGGGLVDEGEDIQVVELLLDEAIAMIGLGEIVDAKTIMLLQWAAPHGIPKP